MSETKYSTLLWERWYNPPHKPMKTFVFSFMFPLAALDVEVPSLLFDASAFSEATTNIPFEVDFETMSRIEFTLALNASPTNSVEVAIGTDVNEDGVLGLAEADWTLGFNCGKWFCREAAVDDLRETDAPTDGRTKMSFVLKRPKMGATWNLVRVTRRGAAKVGEVVVVEGKRPGVVMEIR